MSKSVIGPQKTMGTTPVFMTAISTILGAILFLRFGYAVGNVGLIGTLMIILIGHLVTIPTAMAVAEIATNQKVEGGGAYYIISRSFGLNIGGAIGIALYLSQAISVSFYIIAFMESTRLLRDFVLEQYGFYIYDETVTYAMMALLTLIMLTKGANIGVKALYGVVLILFVSLAMFFAGNTDYTPASYDPFARVENPESFFYVFTIIFPAFTGIAAGLGLSGDLKDPKRAIPRGTLWATVGGIVVYVAVAFKLFYSASPEDLADITGEEMVMQKIAAWGPIIPIGLACAALSSALGSVMVAPRTLQALGSDQVFPGKWGKWMGRGRAKDGEPINASVITCLIAALGAALGDINVVAEIIAMFFMVTYGAICMVSFLEHFAADPSYRPTFRSRWYVSLFGGLLCVILMFLMNPMYASISVAIMVIMYIAITRVNPDKSGLENLFKGVIFQMSRELQILLQRNDAASSEERWRPFLLCISRDSFRRRGAFDMVRWISYKYGFGTYIHYIEGYLDKDTKQEADETKSRLIQLAEGTKSKVYLDTIVSPSYTSAIAQSVQLPGISGKGNNLILHEYSKNEPDTLDSLISNYQILKSIDFDVCVLRSSYKGFGYKKEIHIWITTSDSQNANLMVLIGYIILGHPEWKKGVLKIFSIFQGDELAAKHDRMIEHIKSGRLPISINNISYIRQEEGEDHQGVINKHSVDADLVIVGFNDSDLDQRGKDTFRGYEDLGNILFLNTSQSKELD